MHVHIWIFVDRLSDRPTNSRTFLYKKYICLSINITCSLFTGTEDTDFRNGQFGMWENDIYDTPGLNWVVRKGDTPTEGTGPHSDHTTKKGMPALD